VLKSVAEGAHDASRLLKRKRDAVADGLKLRECRAGE
jgi:hypothetical protein